MLLQKRASTKYHCPNLWTNACCSHPNLEISIEKFAEIRLQEEMGMSCGKISREFSFIYRQEFDNGLTEYELDHVLTAVSDEVPIINLEEVGEFRYIKISDLYKELAENPAKFTIWFQIICADKRFKKILRKFLK
jgi:isopentenyl-diphosphate delta-isomerase